MSIVQHFRDLVGYETWANRAALASIETVPAASRSGVMYTRALQVMSHGQLVRRAWLARLQGRHEVIADWFPSWTVGEIAAASAEMDAAWTDFLATLSDADLTRVASYKSSDGTAYANTVHEVLTHVSNHSTYHRGQVARLVSEAGGRRAVTDYIAMTRKSMAP